MMGEYLRLKRERWAGYLGAVKVVAGLVGIATVLAALVLSPLLIPVGAMWVTERVAGQETASAVGAAVILTEMLVALWYTSDARKAFKASIESNS